MSKSASKEYAKSITDILCMGGATGITLNRRAIQNYLEKAYLSGYTTGYEDARKQAISLDPWKEHLAFNPIANTLSTPSQCVEVKNRLIAAMKEP